jgi:hypothetical protein
MRTSACPDVAAPFCQATSTAAAKRGGAGATTAYVKVLVCRPPQSNWSGPQHIDYAPVGMRVWGYTNNIRSVRGVDFVFDFPSLESILGESIDLQQTETPRLQFFDERIFRIGSLLAAECIHPAEHSDLYGDSLVTALVIGFLRFGRDRAQEKKQGTLAPRSTKLNRDHTESGHPRARLALVPPSMKTYKALMKPFSKMATSMPVMASQASGGPNRHR